MDIFFIGIIVLLAFVAVFFIVIFGFVFYWHLTKVSIFVLPAIFTFELFFNLIIWVTAISLIIYYAPSLINFLNL